MLYTAYEKECRLVPNKIFEGQYGLRAEYKKDDKWVYIAEPSLSDLSTKEKTDAAYQKALDEINSKMAEMFGKVPSEPQSGFERIQWLADNSTFVENNQLKIKD